MPPPPGTDWAEKHRPQRLDDVIGHAKILSTMRQWAQAWRDGPPEKRALILEGKPGIGKTTAAHALAREMGWGVIELNASDARNAAAIERVATRGATHQTFSDSGEFLHLSKGGRKLIVLDEADNLYERIAGGATVQGDDISDRGGKRAIIQTVQQTQQPVILIVNDLYELTRGSGAALKRLAETIKFQRPQSRSVAKLLAGICAKEGIEAEPEALMAIADHAEGDVRAAINDLQSVAQGRKKLRLSDVGGLGYRDTGRTVFQVLPEILKGTDASIARRAPQETDENPESFILWIDENLPLEYQKPTDLDAAYQALSKADVYLGRVRRRQYYGLWSYASEMMTAGVNAAKTERPRGWTRYRFPTWLLKMSRSRATRNLRNGLGSKIGRLTHASRHQVLRDDLDFFGRLADQDEEFAAHLIENANLSADELAHLLGVSTSAARIKRLMEAADRIREKKETDLGAYARRNATPFDAYEAQPDPEDAESEATQADTTETEANDEPDDTAPADQEEEEKKNQKKLFDF